MSDESLEILEHEAYTKQDAIDDYINEEVQSLNDDEEKLNMTYDSLKGTDKSNWL